MNLFEEKKIIVIAILISIIVASPTVLAEVMHSTNYKIQSDSLNAGGGDDQSSANYKMKDTIGEIATGPSTSANYELKAGYRQMEGTFLSVSSPSDITLTPSIPGITGNPGSPASGDATWTIIADSPAGFNMSINATTDPALMLDASYYFYDYTPAAAGSPDYTWTTPLLSSAEFGFTVEPETAADTATKFLDDGGANCEISGGANGVNTCWLDFNGSTNIPTVNRGSATDGGGEDEKIRFRAESNAAILQEGNYTATITVTVSEN